MYPYDRTLWQRARDPCWWALHGLRAVPVAGVQPFVFGLIFALIDRTDTYQLVFYIYQFKAFQFFTTGVAELLYGAMLYFWCVTLKSPDNPTDCQRAGPGAGGELYGVVCAVGFLAQLLLVWCALLAMRCSVPKGGTVRRGASLVGDAVMWKDVRDLRSSAAAAAANGCRDGADGANDGAVAAGAAAAAATATAAVLSLIHI